MSNRFLDALQARELTGGLPAFMRDVKKRQAGRIEKNKETIQLREEEVEGLDIQITNAQRLLQRPGTQSWREVIFSDIIDRHNQIVDIAGEIDKANEAIQDAPLLSASELGLAGRRMT
jgi:hypothetical protein